jgi:hypothetical protein
MLLISDLQLITGLAIIICGFVQRKCGLSAYHWRRVVQLAWFSSVTHLCCLTFLRDYLHTNKTAQWWRVPGIILLATLLISAQASITHFAFNDADAMLVSRPKPHDYAICFLNHHEIHPDPQREELTIWAIAEFNTSRQRVVCAAVLLGFGTLNRLWRLYDPPTTQYLRLRTLLSKKITAQLERLFIATKSDCISPSWATVLIYCPVLTIALGLRVLSDILTSKAFEVSLTIREVGFQSDYPGLVASSQLLLGRKRPMATEKDCQRAR